MAKKTTRGRGRSRLDVLEEKAKKAVLSKPDAPLFEDVIRDRRGSAHPPTLADFCCEIPSDGIILQENNIKRGKEYWLHITADPDERIMIGSPEMYLNALGIQGVRRCDYFLAGPMSGGACVIFLEIRDLMITENQLLNPESGKIPQLREVIPYFCQQGLLNEPHAAAKNLVVVPPWGKEHRVLGFVSPVLKSRLRVDQYEEIVINGKNIPLWLIPAPKHQAYTWKELLAQVIPPHSV